eukprot:TRINITY_DN7885_c0_g1_i2.p1 TRINITY_DN7885_c0_g1~~TRINITY_DN7885_c0_g1_i2.p1  ORF type:complete len:212 (+),score=22.01 TRINITY_DN7885_c0_g1_i2:102-737(+)
MGALKMKGAAEEAINELPSLEKRSAGGKRSRAFSVFSNASSKRLTQLPSSDSFPQLPTPVEKPNDVKRRRWFETELFGGIDADSPILDYFAIKQQCTGHLTHRGLSRSSLAAANKRTLRSKAGSGDLIMQPAYMAEAGSMCITELWTRRQKRSFKERLFRGEKLISFDDEICQLMPNEGLPKQGNSKRSRHLGRRQLRILESDAQLSLIHI